MDFKTVVKNKKEELALSAGIIITAMLMAYALFTHHFASQHEKTISHTYRLLLEVTALTTAVKEAETAQKSYLITAEPTHLQTYQNAAQSMPKIFQILEELTAGTPLQQERLNQLEQQIKQIQDALEETIRLRREEGLENALVQGNTLRYKQLMDAFDNNVTNFKKSENTLLLQNGQAAKASNAVLSMLLFTIGAFVIACLFFGILMLRKQRISRKKLFEELDRMDKKFILNNGERSEDEDEVINALLSNLQNTKDFIRNIGNKNFEGNIAGLHQKHYHLNKDNMAGALLDVRSLLLEKEKQEGVRQWFNEGIANFSEIIRQHNQNLGVLADVVLQELIKYVKANQGAIYITQEEDKADTYMEVVACYAWNKKKYIHSRIEKGEGLAGQAWQEGDTLYLTDVPQDYIRITSGLGAANPNCILIVPLKINEAVLGVLEMASFKTFEKHEIDFIEKIAETIASSFSTVKITERTKWLLESSQEQTEEMRAQEEEMRQNMEEMQATQEELGRKLAENEKIKRDLDAYLKALDGAALMSEADIYGTITSVNDRFCEVAKYTREEVIGKPHNILRHPDNPKELFKEMWDTLKAGNVFKGRYPNRAKDGSTYWVDATIEPVFGPDGKIEKYIGIRFDITEQVESDLEVKQLVADLETKVEDIKGNETMLRNYVIEQEKVQEELAAREKEASAVKEELKARMDALDAAALMSEADIYGNITYVNSKFCEVAKYTPEEVMGKPHNILRHPDNSKALFKEMWETIKAGEIFQGRYPNRAKDGSTYWVDATIVPVLDKAGKPFKYIGVRFDVTAEMEQAHKKQQHSGMMEIIESKN